MLAQFFQILFKFTSYFQYNWGTYYTIRKNIRRVNNYDYSKNSYFLSCLFCAFRISHIKVKEGMKSVPGNSSSMKLKTPPMVPRHPPKSIKNNSPEIGAHTRSANSPSKGME